MTDWGLTLHNDLYQRGLAAARSAHLGQAVELLTQALWFGPGQAETWRLLGLCCYRQGWLADAELCWMKSLAIEPDEARSTAWLSHCRERQLQQEKWLKRIRTLNGLPRKKVRRRMRRLQKKQGDPQSLTVAQLKLIGTIRHLTGDKKAARQIWQLALSMDLDDPESVARLIKRKKSR